MSFPSRTGLAVVFLVFAIQLALTIVAVPPWQNPDEPQHVMFASVIAKYGPGILPNASDDAIEGDIVQSMARHRWWTLAQRPVPAPLPRTFEGIQSVQMSTIHGPAMYYIVSARLLNGWPLRDATQRLYALRIVSALFALVTLACIWKGTDLLLGDGAAFVVASAAAIHPQFAIVSTTAGPDAYVNLAGSVMWWQIGSLLAGRRIVGSLVILWAAALTALFFARLGAPLLAMAAAVSLWIAVRRRPSPDIVWPLRLGVPAAIGVVALLLVIPGVRQPVWRIVSYALAPIQQVFVAPAEWMSPWAWFSGVYTSFWFTAGWMRYPPPVVIASALLVAALVAMAGIIKGWRREAGLREPIALLSSVILIQGAAVVTVFYLNSIGGQGRYLFPVIGPILTLFWLGFSQLASADAQRSVATVMVAGVGSVNLVSWMTVMLPTFLQ